MKFSITAIIAAILVVGSGLSTVVSANDNMNGTYRSVDISEGPYEINGKTVFEIGREARANRLAGEAVKQSKKEPVVVKKKRTQRKFRSINRNGWAKA